MTKEQVESRINELKELKEQMQLTAENKKIEYATKQAEYQTDLDRRQREIDANNWDASEEARELEELEAALKIMNR